MSGLCHLNLQNARVDLQSGHADFIECSSVFCIMVMWICIMVMMILQNSRVNNWSWHMSELCHVNFAECLCGFTKWSCRLYRMLICILHNGHADFAEQSCK
jgi:hypothetical protein